MKNCTKMIVVLVLLPALVGCSILPRGAGLQSEILNVARNSDGSQGSPDFAVEIVTRVNLETFASWPEPNGTDLPWIERIDQPNTRTIAPGDTLRVTIWSNEANGLLTNPGERHVTLPDLRVSPTGSVFLPYIGDQRVSGMSPGRAREVIEEKYLSVTPSAQVQLELTEGRARVVSLIGGVNTPGSYPLPDNDFTLLSLLADGGGVAPDLRNPQIRLHRNGHIFGISFARLLETPSLDTTLEGGDKVVVQSDDRTFLSLGAAGTEAVHPFPTDQVNALEALSIIGGLADTRANPQGILILRRYAESSVRSDRSGPDHPRTIFALDLTNADGLFSAEQFAIQSGDLVYITESPVTAVQSIFALLGRTLSLRNQLIE